MKKTTKKPRILFFGILFFTQSFLIAQNPITVANAESKPLKFIKITEPVRNIKTSHDGVNVRSSKKGNTDKSDRPINEKTNKNALPLGVDPAWQKTYSPSQKKRALAKNWEGIGPENYYIAPGDPSMDVGPNHIVQMANGIGGSQVEIWDKNGNSLTEFILDGVTTISGYGDPIVIYDQLADRWLLSEFGEDGNTLIIAISTSADPTGSYAIYSFTTPEFPDYPKYAIWNDSYIVTTFEATYISNPYSIKSNPRVYALDRTKMLAGDPSATIQQFDLTPFESMSFQSAAPVNLDGTTLPPDGASGMVMRMADDGWTGVSEDRLEIFEVEVDFNNSANSSMSGPFNLPTEPFDTGIPSIRQPDAYYDLDPLRQVLMNKVMYRNFGSYESIVCNHVTDVTGNYDAGVRWYELRRIGGTNGSWTIHQQGTYSPDNTNRWMGSIGINEDGSIGLAYNVSGVSVSPGLRYTGRTLCDPYGEMTYPETTIIEGEYIFEGHRWGDYNTLSVDPIDGSFWFAGQYAANFWWATRVAQLEFSNDCNGVSINTRDFTEIVCQSYNATYDFDMLFIGGYSGNVNFSIVGLPVGTSANFNVSSTSAAGAFTLTLNTTNMAVPDDYNLTLVATDGTVSDSLSLSLRIDSNIVTQSTLLSPANNSIEQIRLPTFSWSAVPGASLYRIDISTDVMFANIIETSTLSDTSYTPQMLTEGTQYFWRVNTSNSCGVGPFSSTFNFETIVCRQVMSTDERILIALGYSVIQSKITVTDDLIISDVNIVNLSISHHDVSDLKIYLTSPSGQLATVVRNKCFRGKYINCNFDDLGIPVSCPMSGETFAPEFSFSVFNSEPATGTWTLGIVDTYNFDGGFLNSWGLEFCGRFCPVDYENENQLTGALAIDTDFETDGVIVSNQDITNNATVKYNSGSSVHLIEDFEVMRGSTFHVFINGCYD